MSIVKTKKRSSKSTAAGRSLIRGLKQVHAAVVSGVTGLTIRQVDVPDPQPFVADDVRALRDAMGVSVAVFARLVGVSPAQVEHWEQGRRTPAPLACRLMERIRLDPGAYVKSLAQPRG
jgi:DNA-binding transcriptional regulator YiaG